MKLSFTGPVILSDGGNVENQAIINDFINNNTLTLTCTSDNMLDVVEWIIVNQTGMVHSFFSDISNVSSTITFTNASDNFTSYMRCSSNNGYLSKEAYIVKGILYLTALMILYIPLL